ncbi:MAG: hypothetical protein EZS28_023085 [Streblomastix strix]|uniref:Uncharacterized protein n=1 Tax=Streblomastix strix TaxID=222440 RepID=A0A5J4VFJ7_9EUKA|nr:MAG: hypothetical protein EZS28_023085 [Streblomastix strix]
MSDIKKKDLTDEDKIRIQLIDEAINRIKTMPADQSTNQQEQQVELERTNTVGALQSTARSSRKYNINKYKEVDRTTAQVEPEQVVKNTYLSHPNLEVMKFIIDKICATITTRKRGDDFIFSSDNFIKLWALITQENEDDIEIVLEEPLMRAHSCIGKTYKKKDLICVMDVLIKNVSISVIDNEINVFVPLVVDEDYEILNVINGVKTFLQPVVAEKFVKNNGASNQILLANGDTIDKDKLDYEPIQNATYQAVAYGMYEQLLWGTLTTQNSRPKFSGTPRNIPLNAFMYNTKQPTTPVVWLNPIAIDCYIDPDGHVKINSICKYYLPDDFCVQVCDSYAIYNQSA